MGVNGVLCKVSTSYVVVCLLEYDLIFKQENGESGLLVLGKFIRDLRPPVQTDPSLL